LPFGQDVEYARFADDLVVLINAYAAGKYDLTFAGTVTVPLMTAACLRICSLTCEQSALIGPVERQIEPDQTRRRELDRLLALKDLLNQLRAQKGEVNKTPNVTPGDPVTLGQCLQRSSAARPAPPAWFPHRGA
jgi:anti-sigma factor ChrR (cupin superfamily)